MVDVDKAAEEKSFAADEMFEFLCECGANEGEVAPCEDRVFMTISEYDQVRSQDDCFVVYPGHETKCSSGWPPGPTGL